MVLLIIIGLKRLKVVIIKLSFICFYFLFFSMKSKTHDAFVRSQLRSDLVSEKFKHLTSWKIQIYYLQININCREFWIKCIYYWGMTQKG